MRFRRETGDFQIKATPNGVSEQGPDFIWKSIRPGLSAEDLIGETVLLEKDDSRAYLVITLAGPSDDHPGLVEFRTNIAGGLYNPATGEIITVKND